MTDLAERYGSTPPVWRRLTIAGVALVATAGLGWLLWAMVVHVTPKVQSELVSFAVVDAHRARATVTVVRRDADVRASCVLQAQAADHSVVGELTFHVGPARPDTAKVTRDLRTEREATTVLLLGCTAPGQNRPR